MLHWKAVRFGVVLAAGVALVGIGGVSGATGAPQPSPASPAGAQSTVAETSAAPLGTETEGAQTEHTSDLNVTPDILVSFDLNGGVGEFRPSAGVQGQEVDLPTEIPTRDGFTFRGWQSGGDLYQPGDHFTVPEHDVVLAAEWEKVADTVFSVSFKLNGGVGDFPPFAGVEGQKVELPTEVPTREGFTFLGWKLGTDSYQAGAQFTIPSENVFLVAQWGFVPTGKFTVSFNLNGGTGDFLPLVGVEGDALELPTKVPTRARFSFLGWKLDKDLYPAGAQFIVPGENITLVAQWEEMSVEEWTVSFNLNGGAGKFAPFVGVEGEVVELPVATPTKDSFVFLGWKWGKDLYQAGAQFVIPGENATLIAQWGLTPAGQFTASFNLNGGAGDFLPLVGPEGHVVELPTKVPTKGSFAFLGWQLNGDLYQAGETFTIPAHDVVFIAQWAKATAPVPPTKPVEPVEPAQPGETDVPSDATTELSDGGLSDGGLPSAGLPAAGLPATGADVWPMVVTGALLTAGGVILTRSNKSRKRP